MKKSIFFVYFAKSYTHHHYIYAFVEKSEGFIDDEEKKQKKK